MQQVKRTLDQDVELPMKVAVMGCVVNGPAKPKRDVAVFAGDRRGIIYVQGEKVANVFEEEILDLRANALTSKKRYAAAKPNWEKRKWTSFRPTPLVIWVQGSKKIRRGLSKNQPSAELDATCIQSGRTVTWRSLGS